MIWIFGGILVFLAAAFLLSLFKRAGAVRAFNRKEHPLRILYPMAAGILKAGDRFFPAGRKERLRYLLRSIYVKENVEQEIRLYRLRKMAVFLAVTALICLIGFGVCLQESRGRAVRSLQRAEPGQGSTRYELDVSYRQEEETITLDVDAVRLTESEIRELFEWSFEDVRTAVLGDNPSPEEVTKPLHLIREYRGFDIYWEIDDLSALDYNGEIKAQAGENGSRMVNLYATFSLDDVVQTYTIGLHLVPETPDEKERLLNSIREGIRENAAEYDREVALPSEIDGYPVEFYETTAHNGFLFLILAIAAAVSILLFYDRTLKEKVQRRRQQMLTDFPEIVSKLSLLYEAGLSIHGAFVRITKDYERKRAGKKTQEHFAYREMQLALEKIASGVSEKDAYAQFGKRCGLYPYIKLGNLLEQNLSKGARGMKEMLKQEVDASLEERKRLARRRGEEAGTKMLIPMAMLLLVVIAIIAVPALMSIGL